MSVGVSVEEILKALAISQPFASIIPIAMIFLIILRVLSHILFVRLIEDGHLQTKETAPKDKRKLMDVTQEENGDYVIWVFQDGEEPDGINELTEEK